MIDDKVEQLMELAKSKGINKFEVVNTFVYKMYELDYKFKHIFGIPNEKEYNKIIDDAFNLTLKSYGGK